MFRLSILLIVCIILAFFVPSNQTKLAGKKRGGEIMHQYNNENITILQSRLDSKSMNSLQGLYRDVDSGSPVYIRRVSPSTMMATELEMQYNGINISDVFSILNLLDYTTSSVVKKWSVMRSFDKKYDFNSFGYRPTVRDTLLVFTTCNHVNMSIHSLESLSSSPDQFDILVIDDHSVDGTVQILTKKGYSIITKPSAKGLTDSWNIGYHVAMLLKYRYIIFSNNDVLVPHGTIDIVRSSLMDEALVVPLTTKKGAGHNPTQSIETQYSIGPSLVPFFNNPSNFQLVQDMLSDLYNSTEPKYRQLLSSKYKGKLKFNGFFFAINMAKIKSSAYNGSHLFDPHNVMVEQEDTLMASMMKHKLSPKICKYLFVYHYKSVTVKAAGSTGRSRNNLKFFHPEIATGTSSGNFTAVHVVNSSSSNAQSSFHNFPTKDRLMHYSFLSHAMGMDRAYSPNTKIVPKVIAIILPHPITRSIFTSEKYGLGNDQNQLHLCSSNFRDSRSGRGRGQRAQPCCANKVRQDIAAAIRFSQSLQNLFDIEIKFLFDEPFPEDNWYNLSNIDLIVNMALGSYSLDHAFHLKTSLIKVVWITDMFEAWNYMNSVGNYDLVLAPSDYARDYIRGLQALPSPCVVKCPRYLSVVQQQSEVLVEAFPPISLLNFSAGPIVPKLDLDFVIDVSDPTMEAMSIKLAHVLDPNITWGVLKRNCRKNIIWKHYRKETKIVTNKNLQSLLRSTKIIVLKISVISLFNGIEPFVLDALMSGASVLLFQPSPQVLHSFSNNLPVYSNVLSLASHLEMFVSKPVSSADSRSKNSTYEVIRQEILEDYSSFARAAMFSNTLKNSGMMNIHALSVPSPSDFTHFINEYQTLCIGIVTAPNIFNSASSYASLENKIVSLVQQFVVSKHRKGIRLHIYVAQPMLSTDRDQEKFKRIIDNCEKVVKILGMSHVVTTTLYWNHAYRSDVSIMRREGASPVVDDVDDFLSFLRTQNRCDWCMLSHLEWTHTKLWMDTVLPHVFSSTTKVVAWDFLSTDSKYIRDPVTLLVTSRPSSNAVSPWSIMFQFGVSKSRFLNIEVSAGSSKKAKSVNCRSNGDTFAVGLLLDASPQQVTYLHASYPSHLMIHESKITKKSANGFQKYMNNLRTKLY